MQRASSRHFIVDIISALYIVLFVYAALAKLMDIEKFTVQLGQSPLLMAFAPWVAYGVPVVELIVAALLFFQRWRLLGLYASFTIMVMFTMYILVILNFADHVPCSCGGLISTLNWTQHLVLNIGFLMLAVIAVYVKASQTGHSAAPLPTP